MAGVTQLNTTQLTPGYFSITVSMATNPLVDEAARQGRDDRGNEQKTKKVGDEKWREDDTHLLRSAEPKASIWSLPMPSNDRER